MGMDDVHQWGALRVIADNDDAWTLGGTNTWLVVDDSSGSCVVIDPGPDLRRHADALTKVVADRRLKVESIVVTHCHEDHADLAPGLSEFWDTPVRAVMPSLCREAPPLSDGDRIHLGDRALSIAATPGHTDDSVCLLDEKFGVLYTGDTVLGSAPTVIDEPGGSLKDYFDSIDRLLKIARGSTVRRIAPGHGQTQDGPYGYLQRYAAHRRRRLEQVSQLVEAGVHDPHEICARLYPSVDPVLASGALGNVLAALRFIDEGGRGQPTPATDTPEEIP